MEFEIQLKNMLDATKRSFGFERKTYDLKFHVGGFSYALPESGQIRLEMVLDSHLQIFHALHEMAHLIVFWKYNSFDNHGKLFKKVEGKILKMWGYTIKYRRSYPRSLSLFGKKVFERSWSTKQKNVRFFYGEQKSEAKPQIVFPHGEGCPWETQIHFPFFRAERRANSNRP